MLRHIDSNKESDFENDSINFQNNNNKTISCYDKILLNRPSKVLLALLVVSILIPIILYNFVFTTVLDSIPKDGYSTGSCVLPRSSRITCGAGNISSPIDCHDQCCYDEENRRCYHRLPSRFSYIMDREWSDIVNLHPRIETEPFARRKNIEQLRINIDEVSNTHISFLFYDPQNYSPTPGRKAEQPAYSYEIRSPEFDLTVSSRNSVVLTTHRSPFIASDNIWEIVFRLTNETMYGLGDIPLKSGTTKVLYNNIHDYGTIPLIFARINNNFHGFLLDIGSPAEVTILEENQIMFRTITQKKIKFHLFMGPTPKAIMNDVHHQMGRPTELSYWMLGPHYCREALSTSTNALDELKEFLANSSTLNLPIDSLCGVAPVTFALTNENQYQKKTFDGMEAILAAGKKFVPHFAPYIQFTAVDDQNTEFVRRYYNSLLLNPESRDPYIGSIEFPENHTVIYPDYHKKESGELLQELIDTRLQVHGLILTNTWPKDESEKRFSDAYMQLPYFNQNFEHTMTKTIPWNVQHPDTNQPSHIYYHNNYGNYFHNQLKEIFRNVPMWSTSPWMDTTQIVFRQNIETSWTSLRSELTRAALGSVSGQWLWSTPACGDTDIFDSDSQGELCIKWYLASVFLPLLTISSKAVGKDPLAFEGLDMVNAMTALHKRISLLPYFFTTLQVGPLLRPMFYQYPELTYLHDLSSQFCVGNALVVVPNLLPSQSLVNAWLPNGTWYEMWGGLQIDINANNPIQLTTITSDIVTFVKAGEIIVLQEDVQTSAEETRRNSDYTILIALECGQKDTLTAHNLSLSKEYFSEEDKVCHAEGDFFLSPEFSFHFQSSLEMLSIRPSGTDWGILCGTNREWSHNLGFLKIYGLPNPGKNTHDHSKIDRIEYNLCDMQSSSQAEIYFT